MVPHWTHRLNRFRSSWVRLASIHDWRYRVQYKGTSIWSLQPLKVELAISSQTDDLQGSPV